MADLSPDHPGNEAPPSLGRLSVPKASDVLADHLRQQIRDGTLPEGAALPVERELAAAVGLGRQTVRDALRVLEIEGLLVTRAGRAGGSFVRRPDAGTLERNLHALVSGRGVRLRSLLEAREALEPAAARLAALHCSPADLTMLDEAAARLASAEDVATFLQCNADWHVAIATASHNEIIEAVVSSLSRVILRSTDIDELNSEATMAATLKAHDRILAAIRTGDGDRAAAAMAKHVHTYRELVETYDVPEDVPL
jgi:GntR family transcriptional repressor for pyruvate dehydrogenase complex